MRKRPPRLAFTLVELMAASTILTILALMAVPFAQTAKDREQEVQLRDSLNRIRRAIQLYAYHESDSGGDNDGDGLFEEDPAGDPDGDGIADDDRDGFVDEDGPPNYPPTLDDLVARGYLKAIPPDPFKPLSAPAPGWEVLTVTREAQKAVTQSDSSAITQTTITVLATGIYDIRSQSNATGLDGRPYSQW